MTELEFNKALIDRSRVLLAPLTGGEIIPYVATGHTRAFVRAVNHCCKSFEETAKDSNGQLDADALCHNDPVFAKMCREGWEWTVIPASVEERWPKLPGVLQQTFNASNNVASTTSDLKAACIMAGKAQEYTELGVLRIGTHARMPPEPRLRLAHHTWTRSSKM